MKIDRTRAIWIGVAGLLLAGALYAALNWFEIVDHQEWTDVQGPARTNPYLAMQRMLADMGAKTILLKQQSDIDTLPEKSTLILGDRRLARMTPKRVARLVQWVRAGGHLIVEAEQPKLDDPVLAAFGLGHIGLRWTPVGYKEKSDKKQKLSAKSKTDSGAENANDTENADDADSPEGFGVDAENLPVDPLPEDKSRRKVAPNTASTAIAPMFRTSGISEIVYANGATFKVAFAPYQNLRVNAGASADVAAAAHAADNPILMVSDKIGLRMVQFAEGQGRVTAISNFDFMARRQLSKHDHAEFLWHLVANSQWKNLAQQSLIQSGEKSLPVVALALRFEEGGLWKWLGQHAWMVLVAFFSLLLMWILRMVSRFGPLPDNAPAIRLSLGEHLNAMGRYVGRHQGWNALLRPARERILAQLHRQHTGLLKLDRTAQIVILEQATGLNRARIERALFGDVNDRRTFTEVIRNLKVLEHSAKPVPRAGQLNPVKKSTQSTQTIF